MSNENRRKTILVTLFITATVAYSLAFMFLITTTKTPAPANPAETISIQLAAGPPIKLSGVGAGTVSGLAGLSKIPATIKVENGIVRIIPKVATAESEAVLASRFRDLAGSPEGASVNNWLKQQGVDTSNLSKVKVEVATPTESVPRPTEAAVTPKPSSEGVKPTEVTGYGPIGEDIAQLGEDNYLLTHQTDPGSAQSITKNGLNSIHPALADTTTLRSVEGVQESFPILDQGRGWVGSSSEVIVAVPKKPVNDLIKLGAETDSQISKSEIIDYLINPDPFNPARIGYSPDTIATKVVPQEFIYGYYNNGSLFKNPNFNPEINQFGLESAKSAVQSSNFTIGDKAPPPIGPISASSLPPTPASIADDPYVRGAGGPPVQQLQIQLSSEAPQESGIFKTAPTDPEEYAKFAQQHYGDWGDNIPPPGSTYIEPETLSGITKGIAEMTMATVYPPLIALQVARDLLDSPKSQEILEQMHTPYSEEGGTVGPMLSSAWKGLQGFKDSVVESVVKPIKEFVAGSPDKHAAETPSPQLGAGNGPNPPKGLEGDDPGRAASGEWVETSRVTDPNTGTTTTYYENTVTGEGMGKMEGPPAGWGNGPPRTPDNTPAPTAPEGYTETGRTPTAVSYERDNGDGSKDYIEHTWEEDVGGGNWKTMLGRSESGPPPGAGNGPPRTIENTPQPEPPSDFQKGDDGVYYKDNGDGSRTEFLPRWEESGTPGGGNWVEEYRTTMPSPPPGAGNGPNPPRGLEEDDRPPGYVPDYMQPSQAENPEAATPSGFLDSAWKEAQGFKDWVKDKVTDPTKNYFTGNSTGSESSPPVGQPPAEQSAKQESQSPGVPPAQAEPESGEWVETSRVTDPNTGITTTYYENTMTGEGMGKMEGPPAGWGNGPPRTPENTPPPEAPPGFQEYDRSSSQATYSKENSDGSTDYVRHTWKDDVGGGNWETEYGKSMPGPQTGDIGPIPRDVKEDMESRVQEVSESVATGWGGNPRPAALAEDDRPYLPMKPAENAESFDALNSIVEDPAGPIASLPTEENLPIADTTKFTGDGLLGPIEPVGAGGSQAAAPTEGTLPWQQPGQQGGGTAATSGESQAQQVQTDLPPIPPAGDITPGTAEWYERFPRGTNELGETTGFNPDSTYAKRENYKYKEEDDTYSSNGEREKNNENKEDEVKDEQ